MAGFSVLPFVPRCFLWLKLLLRPLQTPRPERPPVQSMQPLRLGACDQRIVRNSEQILRHEPDRPLRSHPVERIETAHVDGPGKSPQRSLPSQIEVHVEITEHQFAQRTIHRFAIAAAGVIRFGQRAPVPVHAIAVYGNYVVRIVLGLQIENQRGLSDDPPCPPGTQPPPPPLSTAFPPHPPPPPHTDPP